MFEVILNRLSDRNDVVVDVWSGHFVAVEWRVFEILEARDSLNEGNREAVEEGFEFENFNQLDHQTTLVKAQEGL